MRSSAPVAAVLDHRQQALLDLPANGREPLTPRQEGGELIRTRSGVARIKQWTDLLSTRAVRVSLAVPRTLHYNAGSQGKRSCWTSIRQPNKGAEAIGQICSFWGPHGNQVSVLAMRCGNSNGRNLLGIGMTTAGSDQC